MRRIRLKSESTSTAAADRERRRARQRRRSRRWLRRFVWLAVLVGIGYGAYRYLRSWYASTPFFRDRLQHEVAIRFDGEVAVGAATFDFLTRTLHASDLTLRDRDETSPQVVLPHLDVKLPYSILGEGGQIAPERVLVKDPVLKLVEKADGTLSPLDRIRVVATHVPVPSVVIEDGTVSFGGAGPVSAILDRILRSDLPRHVERVRLALAPMPPGSEYFVGFNGSLELPNVAPISVFGGIGRDNSIRLALELRELDLGNRGLLDALEPKISAFLAQHVLGGVLSLKVELDLPAAKGATPHSWFRLQGRDLRLSFPEQVDREITGVSFDASFDGQTVRLHEARVPDRHGELVLDGVLEHAIAVNGFDLGNWRLTARGRELEFRDSLASRIKVPFLRHIIDDFDPDGRGELFLELTRVDGGHVRPRWSLKPLGASASYVGHVRDDGSHVGFPYRLTEIVGEISGDGPYVEIRHVRGKHAGFGLIDIDGTVDASTPHVLTDIRVRGDGAPLDDGRLRDALEYVQAGNGAIVDRFHPTGTVDIDVRVWTDPTTFKTHRSGTVKARQLKAAIDDFPLPLTIETGSVTFSDDLYLVQSLVGRNGDATVTIDGKIEVVDHHVGIEVALGAHNVKAADPELKRAFDVMLKRTSAGHEPVYRWEWLEPIGRFDVDVELKQTPNQPMRFKATLKPIDLKVVPKWFAVPIEGVMGRIDFGTLESRPDGHPRFDLAFQDVTGTYRGAPVRASLALREGEPLILDVSGEDVAITEELLARVRDVVDEFAITHPRVHPEPLFDVVSPGGFGSFRLALGHDRMSDRLDLTCRDVNVAMPFLPGHGTERATGRIVVDFESADVELTGLVGTLRDGNGIVRCSRLTAKPDDAKNATQIECDLAFEAVPYRAPPADGRDSIFDSVARSLGLVPNGGTLDLRVGRLSISLPRSDGPTSVTVNAADLDMHDLALASPVAVEGIRGQCRSFAGTISIEDGETRATLAGRVDGLFARLGGIELTDAAASLVVEPQSFRAENAVGRVAGGTLRPGATWLSVHGGITPWIRGSVQLDDGDLALLLSQLGIPNSGTRGQFSFEMKLDAKEGRLAALDGEGLVKIRNGRLADIPWIATIYRKTLGYVVGEWLEPTFSSGEIAFRREADRLKLTRFQLDSVDRAIPVGLRLTGSGELGATGIQLRIVPEILRSDDRLIAPLLRLFTKQIFSYRITGSLRNPVVQYSNVAMDLMSPLEDDTNRPRLVDPARPVWRF